LTQTAEPFISIIKVLSTRRQRPRTRRQSAIAVPTRAKLINHVHSTLQTCNALSAFTFSFRLLHNTLLQSAVLRLQLSDCILVLGIELLLVPDFTVNLGLDARFGALQLLDLGRCPSKDLRRLPHLPL
jgi:hypothetical protein